MTEERTLLNATVVFPLKNNGAEILLAKKAWKIGAGCWNGYGGGIEPGENDRESASRELFEESGLSATSKELVKVGVVDFHNHKSDGTVFTCRVHFFFAPIWDGEIKETPEMLTPTWFPIHDVPLDEMMPADRVFLPLILNGKKVRASAVYTPFQKELIGPVEVEEVSELD